MSNARQSLSNSGQWPSNIVTNRIKKVMDSGQYWTVYYEDFYAYRVRSTRKTLQKLPSATVHWPLSCHVRLCSFCPATGISSFNFFNSFDFIAFIRFHSAKLQRFQGIRKLSHHYLAARSEIVNWAFTPYSNEIWSVLTICCDFAWSFQFFFLSLQRNHNILWIWIRKR